MLIIYSPCTRISASSLPIQDNLHPIYSPQTTSLPTPSATIPESRPHSHHQAMGDMFSRLNKMNIKRKIRSKVNNLFTPLLIRYKVLICRFPQIPQAPVELPALSVDNYDIQVVHLSTCYQICIALFCIYLFIVRKCSYSPTRPSGEKSSFIIKQTIILYPAKVFGQPELELPMPQVAHGRDNQLF